MINKAQKLGSSDPLALLAGGGEMGERTRAFDWARTPLGPIAEWPQSLKTVVRTMLDSRYAMWLGWGPDFTFFYNDAYARMTLGPKHPWALGRSAREVWSEIWPDIGPRAESVINTGQATWDEGLLLFLERQGFPEETYHTFSYSPVPDDAGGVGGMLCVVTEDTERTIGERRLRTLRELAARTTEEPKSVEEACQTASRLLAGNNKDVPFSLLYLLDADGRRVTLAGASGIEPNSPISPTAIDLSSNSGPWPFRAVAESGNAQLVSDLPATYGQLPGGAWPEPSHQAIVLPMSKPGQSQLAGFIVAGISPRRPFDDGYRGFLDLLSGQVATAVTNARAYEEERRRVEALAELDRAKTTFFSNVSHEFRTPLTLMLGPIEDMLAKSAEQVSPDRKEQLQVVHRNALRLQRLVNTLLDFSRIEAGRVRAAYEPTDLAALTADLASNFRSACERAGLTLNIDCPPLTVPVFVDRQMWEKVVLNLISNAFKFTLEGEIAVEMRQVEQAAELRVRDTGTGIPADDMPRLFERFHRVENTRGRTHEGSGIGLALVQELIKLHGGSISAESQLGRGTAFTIRLPLGSAHLPSEHIASKLGGRTISESNAFVEESLRWLPHDDPPFNPAHERVLSPLPLQRADDNRPRILIADDNTDMRQYLVRLLSEQYAVESAADGLAALASVQRQPPDLILSDVMMPRMDGFALLRELRADPATASLPVILLSARAGEESRVEGMQSQADDYLVKPFSAKELLARVAAHLQMARLRRAANDALRESLDRFEAIFNAAPIGVYLVDAEFRIRHVNDQARPVFGDIEGLIGRDFVEVLHVLWPPDFADEIAEKFRHTLKTGEPYFEPERVKERLDSGVTEYYEWQINRITLPDDRYGVVCYFSDISRHVLARQAVAASEQRLRESERQLRLVADHATVLIAHCDSDLRFKFVNKPYAERFGLQPKDIIGKRISEVLGEPTYSAIRPHMVEAFKGHPVDFEVEIPYHTGGTQIVRAAYTPEWDGNEVVGVVAAIINITEAKRAELRERQLAVEAATANAKFSAFFDQGPLFAGVMALDGTILEANRLCLDACGYTKEQVVGKKFWDCPWWTPRSELVDAIKVGSANAAQGEVFRAEMPYFIADGSQRMVDFILQPIKDESGQVIFLAPTGTDITDGKIAEGKLRRSEERLRLLWEAAAVLLTTDNPDTMLKQLFAKIGPHLKLDTYFNFMVNEARSGLRLASCTGISDSIAREIEHLEFGQAICGTVAVQRKPIVATFIQDSDDPKAQLVKTFGLRAYACNPLMAGDELLGTLSFASRSRDQFDDEEVDFLQTICQYVTAAYERMRLISQLQESDRRKDEFLATLAHELRNPLAPIRNGLQIMRLAQGESEAVEGARTMMERQLGQMVHLVDDLLDLSRISRGKIELRKERVELTKIVRHAIETSRPVIEQAGHDLTINMPPDSIYVDADLTRLAQVYSNLLNNAAKYTERGGRVELSVQRQGGEAVVSVKDNGIGIPAHMLPFVFDMFTQVDRNLERSQGGLGIGLSIVKRLVEMHGGSVEARSDGYNMGSEFLVRLPVALSVVPPQNDDRDRIRPSSRRRILVVDDNRDAAISLGMMLKLMGNDIKTAHDGLEAIDAASEFRPDLILLDIGMPRLNGYDAARQIRQQSWGKNIVLVALTGWGQEEDRRKSHDAGFDLHLVKPIEPSALKKLLAEFKNETA